MNYIPFYYIIFYSTVKYPHNPSLSPLHPVANPIENPGADTNTHTNSHTTANTHNTTNTTAIGKGTYIESWDLFA